MSCKVHYSPGKYFTAVPPVMLIKLTVGSQVFFFPSLSSPVFFFNKQAVFTSIMLSNGSQNTVEGTQTKAD